MKPFLFRPGVYCDDLCPCKHCYCDRYPIELFSQYRGRFPIPTSDWCIPNCVYRCCQLLWAWRQLGWTITVVMLIVVRQINIHFIFRINRRCVLQTKDEKNFPDSYQQQVQNSQKGFIMSLLTHEKIKP